jgi:hypothetical protein
MTAHEDVEEDHVASNQGDADGDPGDYCEPGEHAYMFNQISLKSQHPDATPFT